MLLTWPNLSNFYLKKKIFLYEYSNKVKMDLVMFMIIVTITGAVMFIKTIIFMVTVMAMVRVTVTAMTRIDN